MYAGTAQAAKKCGGSVSGASEKWRSGGLPAEKNLRVTSAKTLANTFYPCRIEVAFIVDYTLCILFATLYSFNFQQL